MSCCQAVSDKIPARYILCFMLFTGFMVAFLQRVNLSIAIIAMVRMNSTTRSVFQNISNESNQNASADKQLTHEESATPSKNSYEWTEFQQSLILSSFFWGYVLCLILSGRMLDRWGIKVALGASLLINGLLALTIPFFASVHWSLILIVRTLQGLSQGPLFPSINVAAAHWVPPNERQMFISFIDQGISVGNVLALPLCGWILTQWSWPQVFYMSGCVALAWCIAWYFLVHDFPSTHPRITAKEKSYLENMVPHSDNASKMSVPWIKVLTSVQFWVGLLATAGSDCGFHMYNNFGPKYVSSTLGFDVEKSSWLASLPYLVGFVLGNLYGAFCDILLKKQIVSTLFIRKMSAFIATVIPVIGMIALTQVGSNSILSISILTVCIPAMGAVTCGSFQNPIDIAPNFGGVLTGFVCTFSGSTAVLLTPVTGALLQTNGPKKGWQIIFYVTACVYILTSLPYLLIAKAKLQSWNTPNNNDHNDKNKTESTLHLM